MQYVGIDVGGTAIKAALVNEDGSLLSSTSVRTPADDLEEFVETLVRCVDSLAARSAIAGIGIGVAGLRSARTRVIETSPNIPCLRNVNLESLLAERTGIPATSENDANAGAYGEWAAGAARGLTHMAYITLSTASRNTSRARTASFSTPVPSSMPA